MAKVYAFRTSEINSFSHDSTAAALERLTALVDAQARTIRQYEADLAHSRHIFKHASAAARLGVWECDLESETLSWSDGTYDLFELPRGSPLVRKQTLRCYPKESLKALESVRNRALLERSGFSLDAEIVTPKGSRRWIRIHATVESDGDKPTRIFGIKQDITRDKAQSDRNKHLAECDEMTGLANRSKFEAHLSLVCSRKSGQTAAGALLLIDLDGFKDVNDSLGHLAGDECLRVTAQRLRKTCGHASLVARVGGDEFAVFLETPHGQGAELAPRIIAEIRRPIKHNGRSLQIGASVGVAAIDGCQASELFRRADTALYAAKAAGRNTFRVFDATRMRD
ncbi:MAG: sensor domain-containing diguanylate cyclase [Pseudolabrys sp.]